MAVKFVFLETSAHPLWAGTPMTTNGPFLQSNTSTRRSVCECLHSSRSWQRICCFGNSTLRERLVVHHSVKGKMYANTGQNKSGDWRPRCPWLKNEIIQVCLGVDVTTRTQTQPDALLSCQLADIRGIKTEGMNLTGLHSVLWDGERPAEGS